MLKLVIGKVGSEERLEKEAFRMAGGEQGCSLASDPELQSQLSYGRSGWRPRICRSRGC